MKDKMPVRAPAVGGVMKVKMTVRAPVGGTLRSNGEVFECKKEDAEALIQSSFAEEYFPPKPKLKVQVSKPKFDESK